MGRPLMVVNSLLQELKHSTMQLSHQRPGFGPRRTCHLVGQIFCFGQQGFVFQVVSQIPEILQQAIEGWLCRGENVLCLQQEAGSLAR